MLQLSMVPFDDAFDDTFDRICTRNDLDTSENLKTNKRI